MSFDLKVRALRGMHDIVAPDIHLWQRLETAARSIFSRYGFEEIRTPIVEDTQLFARSIGEDTDIVEKEMYTFADRNEKSLTLRPEGTASVVRAVIESGMIGSGDLAGPVLKVFYSGPMFRYERPQKGRQRQFYQIGVEAFNDPGPGGDAEILAMAWQWLCEMGLRSMIHLEINSLGSRENKKAFGQSLVKFFADKHPQLCADCQRRLTQNPLRLLDCKVEGCRQARQGAPSILEFLDEVALKNFNIIQSLLKTLEIPFQVNSNLVRGLDYYTGTTFEFVTDQLGSQGAVLAGGRYDRLMADLGGPDLPAIGFAAGCERLVELLKLSQQGASTEPRKVFLVTLGEEAQALGFHLAHELRVLGACVEADWRGKSMKAQMRQADRCQASVVLILGENEIQQKKVVVKNMQARTQEELSLTPNRAGIAEFLNREGARFLPV